MIKNKNFSSVTHFNKNKSLLFEIVFLILITIIFLALLFHKFFTDPYYYFAGDISEVYFPWWVYLNKNLRLGLLPILNQYWFAGSLPFAALETSIFYPLYVILQFLFSAQKNLDTAYFFHFGAELTHYLIACISFYLLVRLGLKLGKLPSLFGALVYSCSGIFIGRFVHPVVIVTMSWVPLVYLFFLYYINSQRIIFALGCSLILALIVVAGHPQMFFYAYLYFCLAIFYFLLVAKKHDRIRLLLVSLGIILVSLLITAPKVLLTLELAQNIVRTTSETTVKNLYNSIHPLYYLTLLVPYLYGKHEVGYWGSDYPWGNWENFIYIGIIPILFLPFALKWKNKRLLGFFLTNLAVSVLLLLGRYNRLASFLNQNMPFSDNLTMLSKLTNFFHFFLAIIATIGIQGGLIAEKLRKNLLLFVIYFLLLLLLILALKPTNAKTFALTAREPPAGAAYDFIAKNINQSRFLFLLSSVFVFSYLLTRREKLIYGLILVYALDILLNGGSYNPIETTPGPPSKYYANPKILEKVKQDKSIYRIDNLWPRNINMINEVETTYGYHTIETKSYHDAISLFGFANRKIIDLMNVKYMLAENDLGQNPDMKFVSANVWENKSALARVFFVANYKVVKSKDQLLAGLTDQNFNPRREVLLEIDYTGKPIQRVGDTYEPAKYDIKISDYKSDNLNLKIESDRDGFLLFSQFRYPGWTANVDGVRTELLPANLFMYALPVSRGAHEVSFRFDSQPLRLGTWLAIGTFALLLVSIINKKIRKI